MTAGIAAGVDLRRSPLAALRALDFRSPGRDFWADEAAIHDRLVTSWAGLDEAAWALPGAAPSGHLRSHLAMVGPWCAGIGWPRSDDQGGEPAC